jgi:hypothetical protein
MNTIVAENVHSTSQRRRHRRHKDRVPTVGKLFNDEGGHESILYLDQRGLPSLAFTLSGDLLRQTAK